jgi:aspartate aminotransferase-like enzyme
VTYFNYSTGPVELSEAAKAGLSNAPSTSHSPDAQDAVAETITLIREVLRLPTDTVVVLIPGSIRQALDVAVRSVTSLTSSTATLASGYWARFIHNLAEKYSDSARVLRDPSEYDGASDGLVQAVHVETEFGTIVDVQSLLRRAKNVRALTLVDIACSAPVDQFDFEGCDVAILGSHKCLGGAPGLGILVAEQGVLRSLTAAPGASWSLAAYAQDALAKRSYLLGETDKPFGQPPLVTYPMQVVNSVRYSLRERLAQDIRPESFGKAAWTLRAGMQELGFRVPAGILSNAVLRFEVPPATNAEALRKELLRRGYFVIGGVGATGGGVIRIGCMSLPQIDPANIRRFIDVVAVACRALDVTWRSALR